MKSVQNVNSFDDISEIADRYKSALGQYPLKLHKSFHFTRDQIDNDAVQWVPNNIPNPPMTPIKIIRRRTLSS